MVMVVLTAISRRNGVRSKTRKIQSHKGIVEYPMVFFLLVSLIQTKLGIGTARRAE